MVQFDVKRVSKGTESFMVSFDLTKTPITQVADYIIVAASKHNSSDIHFDPREDGMMVRFRIDGDLQDYTFIPKAYERNLTTRLKLLANMNITESRLPQDGAIKGTFGDQYLDMRVSALPLNEGEKIVIRILDYTRSLQGIDSLGFNEKNIVKIKRMMGIPNGIILVTGATGSGKSTTTYSILQGLNKPETNIITVEDPIEMNIEGINQVQVNAEIGMTFAATLRSILRQDPNVILIGEIRDSETAQIAVRASITGHLVLSTIHTNNSLATIERLLDMDVERYLLSTALTGIVSQRLAKQLCPKCRYQRATTPYEKKVFKKYMHQDIATIWDANPKGCEHCRKGYKGRIAIQEVLELDDEIRNALNNPKLEKEELAKLVYTNKTITLLQDALGKALKGLTSFEEVYRVIEIENEEGDNYEAEEETIKETKEQETTVQTSDDLLETPIIESEVNIAVPPINIEKKEPNQPKIELKPITPDKIASPLKEEPQKETKVQPSSPVIPVKPIVKNDIISNTIPKTNEIKQEPLKPVETIDKKPENKIQPSSPAIPVKPIVKNDMPSNILNNKPNEKPKKEMIPTINISSPETESIKPLKPDEKKNLTVQKLDSEKHKKEMIPTIDLSPLTTGENKTIETKAPSPAPPLKIEPAPTQKIDSTEKSKLETTKTKPIIPTINISSPKTESIKPIEPEEKKKTTIQKLDSGKIEILTPEPITQKTTDTTKPKQEFNDIKLVIPTVNSPKETQSVNISKEKLQ